MKLISVFTLLLLANCGSTQENTDVGTSRQAFTNEGQLCGSTYDPFSPVQQWPTHGPCTWMPGMHGTMSTGAACDAPGVVPLDGEVFAYTGINATGSCARWSSNAHLNFQLMAVNGWDNLGYKFLSRTWVPQRVMSVKIGPHTLWSGYNGPNWDGTNSVTFANYTATTSDLWISNVGQEFEVASITMFPYYGGPLD